MYFKSVMHRTFVELFDGGNEICWRFFIWRMMCQATPLFWPLIRFSLKLGHCRKGKKKSQISGSKFCFPLSLERYDPVRYVNEFHYWIICVTVYCHVRIVSLDYLLSISYWFLFLFLISFVFYAPFAIPYVIIVMQINGIVVVVVVVKKKD